MYKVSLRDYLRFVSYIFGVEGQETPTDFIKVMGATPYQPWYGCASFAAIPTPSNEWGWVYETISHRQLIWLPGGIVLARNMRDSEIFKGWVEAEFGQAISEDEPQWLDSAMALAIEVKRPRDSNEEADEPDEADNTELIQAIRHRPLDYWKEVLKRETECEVVKEGRKRALKVLIES